MLNNLFSCQLFTNQIQYCDWSVVLYIRFVALFKYRYLLSSFSSRVRQDLMSKQVLKISVIYGATLYQTSFKIFGENLLAHFGLEAGFPLSTVSFTSIRFVPLNSKLLVSLPNAF